MIHRATGTQKVMTQLQLFNNFNVRSSEQQCWLGVW